MDGSTASLASTASSGMSISSASSSRNTTLSRALEHARGLYAQANLLSDTETRRAYVAEIENVGGLLPYADPRLSPVSYYLDERRRDALADAINGAILCRLLHPSACLCGLICNLFATLTVSLGKPSTLPKLEECVKQNQALWTALSAGKATYPINKTVGWGKPPKVVRRSDLLDNVADDFSFYGSQSCLSICRSFSKLLFFPVHDDCCCFAQALHC